jgi:type IV pilus assembly protein PilB
MKLRRGPAAGESEAGSPDAPPAPTVSSATNPGAGPQIGPRLGELLLERNLVDDGQLAQGLLEQAASGGRLGTALVKLGLLDERDLARVLAEQQGLPLVDLRNDVPEPQALAALSESVARSLHAVPIRYTPEGLLIAVADSEEHDARHVLDQAVDGPIVLVIAPRSDIERTVNNSYRALTAVAQQIRQFQAGINSAGPVADEHAGLQMDDSAPVVKIFDLLLLQAIRDRASDIHIEPMGDELRIRYRIDGALHEVSRLPGSMGPAMVSRIKIMAGMNIVERRRAQDGQIETSADGRPLDVRVSTTSTVFGEKCVLRLLDKGQSLKRMADLGMPADSYERFRELARHPYGMVVVAGPTGSGKTTTLYATLNEMNSTERNLMTIEDPVEYVFPTINQIQIHEQAGVTFANGLRAILRQDPDVILVGEMRDVETSHIAVQAALTGHFVLSSLHSTDAASAVHRFLDMGIEGFLIASSLLGVVAQRLVRRICRHCTVPYQPTADELAFFERATGRVKESFVHGAGCNFCSQTGFENRIGVFELLTVSEEMRELMVANATHQTVREQAIRDGMRPMREEALRLVETDVTTIAEILRGVYLV